VRRGWSWLAHGRLAEQVKVRVMDCELRSVRDDGTQCCLEDLFGNLAIWPQSRRSCLKSGLASASCPHG